MKSEQTLEVLLKQAVNLNNEMEQAIITIVQANGGLIRTDNNERRGTIYAFVMDSCMGDVTEKEVLAVSVFDNNLSVLVQWGDLYDLNELTDKEILELDNWYTVTGGYVTANATLYNLCDCILDYVEQ